MAPTWPQPLKVHQHPVGRAGVDAQRGGALKRDVTWDCDELFLAEHSLGPPGSWGKARGVVEHEKNTGNHKKQMSETNDFCSFLCLSALFFSDVAGFLFCYFLSV